MAPPRREPYRAADLTFRIQQHSVKRLVRVPATHFTPFFNKE